MFLKDELSNSRDDFIEKNKKFIYSITSNICKRNLQWENDDELSIALIAFNNACKNYVENKGNFFSFAKVLIKNALIDYFRKSSNNPYLIFNSDDKELEFIDSKNSLTNYEIQQENLSRNEEIMAFSKELNEFKLSFEVLVDASPSHKDTKDKLLNLAFICSKESTIVDYIYNKKMLPIKEICLLTGENRKLIEKWRRYIIALILIFSNDDYIYLRSYLNIKVGDNNE